MEDLKKEERKQIEEDVRVFLNKGGKIEKLDSKGSKESIIQALRDNRPEVKSFMTKGRPLVLPR